MDGKKTTGGGAAGPASSSVDWMEASEAMEGPASSSSVDWMETDEGPPPPSTSTTMITRKRRKWRRIPRTKTAPTPVPIEPLDPYLRAEMEKGFLLTLANADFIENMREEDCHLSTEQDRLDFYAFKRKMVPALRFIATADPEDICFFPKVYSDTVEERLTAEDLEAQVLAKYPNRRPGQQAKDFAELALAHYNEKTMHKFEMATTLLSSCFSELSGATYGHVNFTAVPQKKTVAQPASNTKRLFFAELKLIPELLVNADSQPMRVQSVYTVDDSCYGGCHEIFRKINYKMTDDMDYERCHACTESLKHPKGHLFEGGHNSSRMPYYSAI